MRFSWNINGQNCPNWQQLLEWGQQVRPSFTLIMDNLAKARQWKDEVGGETILRVWDERDNYYHQHVSAKDASNQLADEIGDNKDLWHYYRLNEPGGNWEQIQNWIIEFAKFNRDKEIKTTSCGLAILKNWHTPEWVQAGHADALIRYAHENRDTFLMDVHSYTTGFAWSDHTPNYPANLFDLELSRRGENEAVINWHDYNPEFTNWYLGRALWVTNIRAKELGFTPLPFIITEGIFDWHASVHEQVITLDGNQTTVAQVLRERYGDDRYNRDMRGVLGSRRLFAWLQSGDSKATISDDSIAEIIMRNFKWFENNYPPNCKGIMLFTMNPDWRFPEGHDYIPLANALLPKMSALVYGDKPDEEMPMFLRTIRAIDTRVRIRQSPMIVNSPQVGWIEVNWTDAFVSDNPIENDGYIWYRVSYEGTEGYAAFTAVNGNALIEIEEKTPPVDDVIEMTKTDFDAILAILGKYQV